MREDTPWESICRRCGRCCYHKIIYRQRLYYTDIPCEFLDRNTMQCRIYSQRMELNPECVVLTPAVVNSGVLPPECAYLEHCDVGHSAQYHVSELPRRLRRRLLQQLE